MKRWALVCRRRLSEAGTPLRPPPGQSDGGPKALPPTATGWPRPRLIFTRMGGDSQDRCRSRSSLPASGAAPIAFSTDCVQHRLRSALDWLRTRTGLRTRIPTQHRSAQNSERHPADVLQQPPAAVSSVSSSRQRGSCPLVTDRPRPTSRTCCAPVGRLPSPNLPFSGRPDGPRTPPQFPDSQQPEASDRYHCRCSTSG